jgi:N-carbamoylputrescine amidase
MKFCLRIILLHQLFIIFLISWSGTLKGQPIKVNPSKKLEVKIAMAQIFYLDGDRAGNFLRIENAIIDAKKQKAEIVTFPESCILGWVNPTAHQRAFPIPGEDSKELCALAKKYKIYLCIGVDEKDGDKLFDSALLIDDNFLPLIIIIIF